MKGIRVHLCVWDDLPGLCGSRYTTKWFLCHRKPSLPVCCNAPERRTVGWSAACGGPRAAGLGLWASGIPRMSLRTPPNDASVNVGGVVPLRSALLALVPLRSALLASSSRPPRVQDHVSCCARAGSRVRSRVPKLGMFSGARLRLDGRRGVFRAWEGRIGALLIGWVLAGSVLAGTSEALEPVHGAYPQSEGVVRGVGQALPVVVTNFGFLTALERSDWRWTCDDVTGETLNFSLPVAFAVTGTGAWLLGTSHGLWRSEDACTWERLSVPSPEVYVTAVAVDRVDETRVWATSSTGGQRNALFVSEDEGRSFREAFWPGETVTLRGLLQGRSGLPLVLLGWEDGSPKLWRNDRDPLQASEWRVQAIPWDGETSIYPLEVDFFSDAVFWLRFSHYERGQESLVRVEGDGFETLLTLDGPLDAFASGPNPGELYAGGRQTGLRRSQDFGKSWGEAEYEPEAGCLVTDGLVRYQCTNNLADGAAVLETQLLTGMRSSLVWFGDVHAPISCPDSSQSAQVCNPAWETQKVLSWLDLSPTPEEEQENTGAGCSCRTSGAASGAPPWGMLLLGLALGVWRRFRPLCCFHPAGAEAR